MRIAQKVMTGRRRISGAAAGTLVAASIILTAAAAPVRLLNVSAHDDAVLIESTEPVAYVVSRPDPHTLLVDLRNVSVSRPHADLPGSGQLAGVKVEQTAAPDGASLARIRVSLTMPSEYRVRSARNTIRVELNPAPGAPRPDAPASAARTPAPDRGQDAGSGDGHRAGAHTPYAVVHDGHAQRQRPAAAVERGGVG